MPKKIKLTMEKIGTIKTIAYHEGVSGDVKVYLQHGGDFFYDRHPDYYPEDHQYDDYYGDGSYPCGCCECCGCSCWMDDVEGEYFYGDEEYEEDEE